MANLSLSIVNPTKLRQEDESAQAFALKFRKLRLHALQIAPEAFASTYHEEQQRGLDQTLERLLNPKADHFYLVDQLFEDSTLEPKDILDANWMGMIVLLGPVENGSSSAVVSARAEPVTLMTANEGGSVNHGHSAHSTLHFHLNGTFVDPRARHGGFGKKMVDAAVDKAKAQASGANVRLTVLVNMDNISARRLYEKVGFVVTGTETYEAQIWSQGVCEKVEKVALQLEMTAVAPHGQPTP